MRSIKPRRRRDAISQDWGHTRSGGRTLRGGNKSADSAIEASKIAGHSDLEMTGEYTFVTPERQNELTRRIQQKISEAEQKVQKRQHVAPPSSSAPEAPPSLVNAEPATPIMQ